MVPRRVLRRPMNVRAMWIAAFPFMQPTTWATEDFGGMERPRGSLSQVARLIIAPT